MFGMLCTCAVLLLLCELKCTRGNWSAQTVTAAAFHIAVHSTGSTGARPDTYVVPVMTHILVCLSTVTLQGGVWHKDKANCGLLLLPDLR